VGVIFILPLTGISPSVGSEHAVALVVAIVIAPVSPTLIFCSTAESVITGVGVTLDELELEEELEELELEELELEELRVGVITGVVPPPEEPPPPQAESKKMTAALKNKGKFARALLLACALRGG
jgi:hypothetical protein